MQQRKINKSFVKPKNKQLEHIEQAQVTEWALIHERDGTLPGIENLYAIPNGGLRHPRVAAEMKRDGVRKGMTDLCLAVARGGYFGLYLEMKVGSGTLSDDQIKVHDNLEDQGYFVKTCWSAIAAKNIIIGYLNYKPTKKGIT